MQLSRGPFIFFFILVTRLLETVLILQGEILSWSLVEVKGLSTLTQILVCLPAKVNSYKSVHVIQKSMLWNTQGTKIYSFQSGKRCPNAWFVLQHGRLNSYKIITARCRGPSLSFTNSQFLDLIGFMPNLSYTDPKGGLWHLSSNPERTKSLVTSALA